MAALTISSSNGVNSYVIGGTPSTGPFPVTFVYFFASEVSLVKNVSGTLTTLTAGVDYTLTGTPADDGFWGGSITLLSALSNCTLIASRSLVDTKATNFPTSGPISIPTMNTLFSRLFSWVQDLRRTFTNALRFPTGEEAISGTLPAKDARALKFLSFASDGTPIAALAVGVGVVSSAMASFCAAASLATARTILTVIGAGDNIAFTGNNTHAGTEAFNAGLSATDVAATTVEATKVTADTVIGTSASVNPQTGTTYTLVSGDNGKMVTLSNAAAIALTVPAGLPAGFSCAICQLGAGIVTMAGSGGVALASHAGLKTAGQYAQAGITYLSAGVYGVAGDTTA